MLQVSTLPEPGQLVEVRRRQWVVADVTSGTLSSDQGEREHIVTLSALDEDSMGEELVVVWELEPGAQVLERAGLPSIIGWDNSERLSAFLDAVRWGAVTNADRSFLQAPFRSGITIEDYQLDPLVRALDMARVNLLIADDVGLGKTIEAGLVIQEMLIRHRARTVFVVCPATLQIKWQTEMQEKFGLEFRIVDTEYIRKLRRQRGIHVNPWTSYPRLIASMDWMKSGEGMRLLKDILPATPTYPRKFDILVVDEAHNVAPASSSINTTESQRTRLIRLLSPHFGHRLFLSATPHNGYQASFTSLLELLQQLAAWASRARNQIDSKAKAILAWLHQHLKPDNKWNNKRVILFTEYRATHSWLHQILATNGFGGERLMSLHGGVVSDEREAIKAAFQANPKVSPVRILLATDAASEGIDLQNHCNYLIHVEIPWNPNVMEQRNGRIDRHGQKEKHVHIWHPIGRRADSSHVKSGAALGDHEYLMRAVMKIDTIRSDLGSVGPVIARQIEEAMLGNRKNLDTAAAEERAAKTQRFMAAEKRLQERIARLHDRLLETRSGFNLAPENIARAVKVALELADKPPLTPVESAEFDSGSAYTVPVMPGSWGKAAQGLYHPHTNVRRPITFSHSVAKGRDDVVLAHLNHKLVQLSLRLLREEVWKLDDVKRLHRVAVYAVPDGELSVPIAAVWSRLVITGGDHRRLHEELTLSGGELHDNRFTRIPQVTRLEALLHGSTPAEPSPTLFKRLQLLFTTHEASIMTTVEARSRDRLRYLENTLDRRKQGEVKDLETILNDLETNIRKELQESVKPEQLLLFSELEQAQLKRDVQALRNRLKRIPEERQQEKQIILKHYANPVERTFPVAVIFLMPEAGFLCTQT